MWRPVATREVLRARAELLERLRGFFGRHGVMEVETPVCSARGNTDPAIDSFSTRYTGPGHPTGEPLFLHTSPEFPMKRLLAAGTGPIYQICKVFRDGERGRLHNPEFTLLEWYRPGFDHHALMDEVGRLVRWALERDDLPMDKVAYGELFERHLALNPHGCSAAAARRRAIEFGLPGAESLDLGRDGWLDLLMTHFIERRFEHGRLTFVYDYPASQAALARIRGGAPPVAERFELYMGPMELANGFHELTDAGEQRRRFEEEQRRRRELGLASVPLDERLLEALASGMPDCAGVALGVDRLLMRRVGADHIDEVMAFPLARA